MNIQSDFNFEAIAADGRTSQDMSLGVMQLHEASFPGSSLAYGVFVAYFTVCDKMLGTRLAVCRYTLLASTIVICKQKSRVVF